MKLDQFWLETCRDAQEASNVAGQKVIAGEYVIKRQHDDTGDMPAHATRLQRSSRALRYRLDQLRTELNSAMKHGDQPVDIADLSDEFDDLAALADRELTLYREASK